MGSQRYILRKVLHALLTLFFVLAANFFMFRMLPGDPVGALTRSERLTQRDVEEQRAIYGLDKPLPEQFVYYLKQTLTGQFGLSLRSAQPVTELIASRVWPTVLLVGLGTLFATVFGILIGIKGGWRRGTFFDTSMLYGSLALYAMPEFWIGIVMLIVFVGILGWFPAGGFQSPNDLTGAARVIDIANHLFLPCLTLTLGYIGEYAIIMRSSLLEVKNEDFITTARAKGVPDRQVRRRHAVPNAFLPTFTLIFLSFGFVIGGAIAIETVFSYPGLGLLTYEAIQELDYPVIEAIFLLSSATVILANLLADITYGYLDPRIQEA